MSVRASRRPTVPDGDDDCELCGWDGAEDGYVQISDRGDIRWIRCECNPEASDA